MASEKRERIERPGREELMAAIHVLAWLEQIGSAGYSGDMIRLLKTVLAFVS